MMFSGAKKLVVMLHLLQRLFLKHFSQAGSLLGSTQSANTNVGFLAFFVLFDHTKTKYPA